MNNEEVNLPIDLPSDLLEKYRKIEQKFYGGLMQNDPAQAFSLWNDLYQEVLQKQPSGKRYHKGGEVHNMGICKLLLMSPLESLNYFMMGFIEDVLSTKTESGTLPEDAPGAQNLRNIFKLTDQQFNLIRKLVEETKLELGIVQNPQDVLNKLASYSEKQVIESVARKFAPNITPGAHFISQIPGEWEKRVFIGGDYVNYYFILGWIKKLVERARYTPILAKEFKTQGMPTRDHALLLLHNCKYAIFDISAKGGHLMEIERTVDYKTNSFFVCLETESSSISAMLDYLKEKTQYFKDFNDLSRKVGDFFSSINS